jgi:hypothetical protein
MCLIPSFHNGVCCSLSAFRFKMFVRFVWWVKGKGFPLQAWSGSWGSAGLGSWIFSTFGTMKVVRSSPLRTGRLYPQEFSWYSFLEAESTPGHMVPSVVSEKIPSDTTGYRSRDLPTSSAVPWPLRHPRPLFLVGSSEISARYIDRGCLRTLWWG